MKVSCIISLTYTVFIIMLQQDSNSSKWSQRQFTPGLTTHPPQSNLKEVTQLFDRMYSNLNSMRLPTASQQDENLLDDSSSFKDRVQIRDFSEYLKPKRTHRQTSPQPKIQNPYTPGESSSPNFSPKLTPQPSKDRSHSRVDASNTRALITERDNEIFQLKQKIKEMEALNKQLQVQIKAKQTLTQPQSSRIKQLEQQLQFTTQNNTHLYRNAQKLQEQIDRYKVEIEEKNKKENELQQRIGEMEKQIATLKKINKQLLKEQSNLVKTSEQEVQFFRTVKDEFEKENNILKKKIQFLQVERNTSLNVLRNITVGDKFFNSLTNRPVQQSDHPSLQYNKIRSELESLKANVNQLSTRKTNSIVKPKRSCSSRKSNLRIQ